MSRAPLIGAALVVMYTALISSADGITKLIAGGYAAPQLFCLSGAIVMGLSILAARHPSQRQGLRTTQPIPMALRSGATVLAAVSFFYAFKLLPFAEVFLFIGLMPLLAGLMSGPILGEKVSRTTWMALLAGFIGILCLFPAGIESVTLGHLSAMSAAVFGTFSMVMARLIGRFETNALAQVFYTNTAIFVTMACALPFVWKPMAGADIGWAVAYAVVLFGARWVLVIALRLLPAYAVTPLMNLQFVWMVAIGIVAFHELPEAGTLLGVSIVIGTGMFLVWDQFTPDAAKKPRLPTGRMFRTDP